MSIGTPLFARAREAMFGNALWEDRGMTTHPSPPGRS